jgi:hypothetical protein
MLRDGVGLRFANPTYGLRSTQAYIFFALNLLVSMNPQKTRMSFVGRVEFVGRVRPARPDPDAQDVAGWSRVTLR